MQRINTTNKSADLFGAGKHGYQPGNPATGQPATELSFDSMNALQEEIAAVIEGVGVILDPANNAQLLESIQRLIDAQSGNYALDTGVANAYVVALSPTISSYSDGVTVRVKVINTNTGAATLNAGGGVVPLVNAIGGVLVAGDVPVGGVFSATYIASSGKFYISSLVQSQTLSEGAADARYAALADKLPAGAIFDFAGTSAPPGSIACPVAQTNISRSTYAALFAAIGTTWGVGDGSTTFGMPWFPANYASVQANGNVGTSTVGENLAHTHAANFTGVINGNTAAIYPQVLIPLGFDAGPNVSIQGGPANLAAGVRVLKCVKY